MNFDRVRGQHTNTFIGRDWLFQKIKTRLDDGAPRPLVLVGEPGIGKTAFIVNLERYQKDVACAYYCSKKSAHGSENAQIFVNTVISGLCEHILDLEAYFKRCLVDNYYEESPTGRFNALIDAARRLDTPAQRWLVLVDALDEASTHEGNAIADIIANYAGEFPSWIVFLVTARINSPVVGQFGIDQQITIDTGCIENLEDLRSYVERNVDVISTVRTLGYDGNKVSSLLCAIAGGNFLIASILFGALTSTPPLTIEQLITINNRVGENGLATPVASTEVPSCTIPPRLGVFFKALLDQVIFQPGPDLIAIYQRVMRVLVVARNPVPFGVFAAACCFTDQEEIGKAIQMLGMLLVITPTHIDLYHGYLREWLLNEAEPPYRVDSTLGHTALAATLNNVWEQISSGVIDRDHAVRDLPYHLAATSQEESLAKLLCNLRFIQAKCRIGLVYSLLEDYYLCLLKLGRDKAPLSFSRMVRDFGDYASRLVAFSRGEGSLPVVPDSVRDLVMMRNEGSDIGNDVLEFERFVRSESHTLADHAGIGDFVLQQARNWGSASLVGKASAVICESLGTEPMIVDSAALSHIRPIQTLRMPDNPAAICMTPDGRVVGVADETRVCEWQPLLSNQPGRTMPTSETAQCLVMTPDGQVLAWGAGKVVCVQHMSNEKPDIAQACPSLVSCIDMTPDAGMVVWGCEDGQVYLLRRQCGTNGGKAKLVALVDSTDAKPQKLKVADVGISANGHTIVAAGTDGTVRCWSIESLADPKVLRRDGAVTAMSMTPDGKVIAWAEEFHTADKMQRARVFLWYDRADDAELLCAHDTLIDAIILAADGHYLLEKVVDPDGDEELFLWRTTDRQPIRQLPLAPYMGRAICTTANTAVAAAGGPDRSIALWDLTRNYGRRPRTVRLGSVQCAYREGVLHSVNASIREWQLHQTDTGITGTYVPWPVEFSNTIVCLCTTYDRSVIAAIDETGLVLVRNASGGAGDHEAQSLPYQHDRPITSAALAGDGQRLVFGDVNGSLHVLNFLSGEVKSSGEMLGTPIVALSINPNGQEAVTASKDGTLLRWNLHTISHIRQIGQHEGVSAVAVGGDSDVVLSGSANGTLYIWDRWGPRRFCSESDTTYRHHGKINCIATVPGWPYALTGGDDSTVRLWDIDTGRCLAIFPTAHAVKSLSPISRAGCFICGTENGPAYDLQIVNLPGLGNADIDSEEPDMEPERRIPVPLKKLFLSYHHTDAKAVARIESALRLRGIVPWLDWRDGFTVGDDVAKEAKRAIREDCFGFMLYAGKQAFESGFIRNEEMFEARHKKEQDPDFLLFPVLCELSFNDLQLLSTKEFGINLAAFHGIPIESRTTQAIADNIARQVLDVVVQRAAQAGQALALQFGTYEVTPDMEGDLLRIDASPELRDSRTDRDAWQRLLRALCDVKTSIARAMGYEKRIAVRGTPLLTGAFMFGRVFSRYTLDITQDYEQSSEVWRSDASTSLRNPLTLVTSKSAPNASHLFIEISCTKSVTVGADSLVASGRYGNPVRLQFALPELAVKMDEATCLAVVDQVNREVISTLADHPVEQVHLLTAIPFATMILLGQRFRAMPPTQCYEWDADAHSYRESFLVPGRPL